MQKINRNLLPAMILLFYSSMGFSQEKSNFEVPNYKRTSFANEKVTLQNEFIKFNLYKRIKGWGWAEVISPSGTMMAVMDHLGEIMLRDQDIPVRLVADSYTKEKTAEGEQLVFQVKSVVVRDVLKGTSFDNWMRYPFTEPALIGTVSITLAPNSSVIGLKYRLESTGNYYVNYIRGPWFKVGESSFGTAKTDALLPGIDWAIDEEWTSGTDFFKDPWALRVAPHPNKVSVPLMAISYKGTGIGLSWNPNQTATRWFNYREHTPQPVFASPNFVDRKNNQLMGLMVPDATIEGHENEVVAKEALELKIGQKVNFDAELWLSKGNSVDVLVDYVKRRGLPEPSKTPWSYKTILDSIANAYNTNFWHEGEGFGINQRPEHKISASVPQFLERYISENKRTPLSKGLQQKIEWSKNKMGDRKGKRDDSNENLISQGEKLLALQQPDGSFLFDPEDIEKDDFKIATSFIEPMGLKGETALDITILPATRLLDIGKKTGDRRFLEASEKAFDFCMEMERPEAGDFWETPLHAANLLAAGHAAVGNYLAYEQFKEDKYKEKAIYWMRALLAFTNLWEPKGTNMLYDTKPVLSSSDWYFANWVRDHVQWEVLAVFSDVAQHNLKWDEIDPEINWLRYQEGITNAAIRWMYAQTIEKNWLSHNLPETVERYENGEYDYAFPDTHNSVTDNYGGMMIMPSAIVANIYYLLDRGIGETKK